MSIVGRTVSPNRLALGVVSGLVLLYLDFPIGIIIPISLGKTGIEFPPRQLDLVGYVRFFTSPEWLDALFLSARVATLTVLIAVPLGLAAALGIVRASIAGKGAITTLVMAPLIVPHIVVALSMFFFYREIGLYDNEVGLALAHAVLALPLVVIVLSASLKGFDQSLEQAAMSLGATWRQAVWFVTLPLTASGVIAAALFAFIVSFDELLIALFVTGRLNQTLPKKLFGASQNELDPIISVVASLLIVFSVVLGLAVIFVTTRRDPSRRARPAPVSEPMV